MNLAAFDAPIETPRFAVRLLEERDLEGLIDVNGDDAVTCWLPYATWRTMDDARAWRLRMTALHDAGRARQLVVVDRTDGRAIGGVLVFAFDDGNQPAELGYVLGQRHWRQGAMREVLVPVLDRTFTDLGARRIEAYVDPRNTASHALLLALGFAHEGLLRGRSLMKGEVVDSNVYGLLGREWSAAKQ